MQVDYYSYKSIYNALPEKYQKEDFLYESAGIPYITFATYDGTDYKTSIKKTMDVNDFLYCVDYSKHMVFNKNFSGQNNLFNSQLRARLGIAFQYGTVTWGKQANTVYTTGNFIQDYYMTQLVVHSLIYKYGDSKSNYGIDFNLLNFKSGTGNLKKKTKAFYEFCCKSKITLTDGNFQTVNFSFEKPEKKQFTIYNDYLETPLINCKVNSTNADVADYKRTANCDKINSKNIIIESEKEDYTAAFKVKLPVSVADQLEPGSHVLKVTEQVTFQRKIAGFWNCSDEGFKDSNQEVGSLIYNRKSVSDKLTFELLIGEVILYKSDSITGEDITDATFELQQYDDTTKTYKYYKNLTYNANTKRYESGNIYLMPNNSNGKFKIIETKPGANYLNDWDGQEFQITKTKYVYEFNVENQPILGKLKIVKKGEQFSFSNSEFSKKDTISLESVCFALYAEEDVFVKGKVFFKKNQKIADLITDKKGEAIAESLPAGKYYFKEIKASNLYELDLSECHFEIKRDENHKYNEETYQLTNILKNCEIQVFKYYFDHKDTQQQNKIPLEGVKFGLYAQANILDGSGKVVIEKDSLIMEEESGPDGYVYFRNLPYADYYIKELEAPAEFVATDEIIYIEKESFQLEKNLEESDESSHNVENDSEENKDTDTKKSGLYKAKKEIINYKQRYNLKLIKFGESFSDSQKETSDSGEYYKYQLKQTPLKDVEFSLYNEDDSLIATAVTNENGIVYFNNIEPGTYYCIENTCPEGYSKLSNKIEVTCTLENLTESQLWENTVYNERNSITLAISKLGEKSSVTQKGITYTHVPLEGVIYGIYQDFDYEFSDGNTLLKNTCVGYLKTNQEGKAVYQGKLPAGKYYLKELKTNPGYDMDKNTYSFEIKQNHDKNTEILLENKNTFINVLSKSSVEIKKVDANTNKPLKNVEFTLYSGKDEKIGVYKTDKKGSILIENLPYGTYYFIETKCKNGYYSTNNKYHFQLKSEERISLNITNTPILKLGFEEHFKGGLICISMILLSLIGCILLNHERKHRR